jgi:surfeit locus 1 family protein
LDARRNLFASLLVLTAIVTFALGIWQIERRTWKLHLIAAVDGRVHALPTLAPGPRQWATLTPEHDAYRRVRVTGTFEHARETSVWATAGRGEGYWLMTPLRTREGWSVLVNRGFAPAGQVQLDRPRGTVTITGLLRVTEPGGTFLRSNTPASNRWYSRDVRAIAAARGLRATAPYFIDADSSMSSARYPAGGLTVVHFRNAHLSYALTWFALTGLSLAGLWLLFRDPRKIS